MVNMAVLRRWFLAGAIIIAAIFLINFYIYVHQTPVSGCITPGGQPATGCTVSTYEALKYNAWSLILLPILVTASLRLWKLFRLKDFNHRYSLKRFIIVSVLLLLALWVVAYIFHIAQSPESAF